MVSSPLGVISRRKKEEGGRKKEEKFSYLGEKEEGRKI
jgi:hypothetical protein